jgi:hypothetical protein
MARHRHHGDLAPPAGAPDAEPDRLQRHCLGPAAATEQDMRRLPQRRAQRRGPLLGDATELRRAPALSHPGDQPRIGREFLRMREAAPVADPGVEHRRRDRPLPPEVWRAVQDGGWVEDVLRAHGDADEADALEALDGHARREKALFHAAQRRTSPPGVQGAARSRRRRRDSFLTAQERARADVLRCYAEKAGMKYEKTLTTSVTASLTHGPLVTTEVPIWVSAKTVARMHRVAQRAVSAGQDNRQPTAKAPALAKFFASEMDRTGREASWRARMKRWNAANPGRR